MVSLPVCLKFSEADTGAFFCHQDAPLRCGRYYHSFTQSQRVDGYKVSWNDGGQVVSPHDTGIIDEVRKIKSVSEIASGGDPSKIVMLGAETDSRFMAEVKKISINSDMIKRNADMGIVYTPLHGTGYKMVPEALAMFGIHQCSLRQRTKYH